MVAKIWKMGGSGNLVKGQFWCRSVTCPCEQWRIAGDVVNIGENLGDEAAADADGVYAELFGPDAFETYSDRREDGHVKYGQESVGNTLGAWEVQGDAAKAKIHDASTMRGLVAEDSVGVCSGHGNAFGLSRNSEDARFLDGKGKSRM
jgi:hypothetical protein